MTLWTRKKIKTLRSDPNDYPWDDIRVPMQNTKINAAKSEPAFEDWLDGIHAYHFGPANDLDESLHFSTQIPHDYAEGTDLRPHLHWCPSTTNTGNVIWELEYVIANIDETYAAAVTNSTITAAAGGVVNHHQLTNFDTITDKNITISAMIMCRLTRLGDEGGDTFTGDAIPLEFDFHYRRDSNGSYHELYKLKGDNIKKKGKPKKPFKLGAW